MLVVEKFTPFMRYNESIGTLRKKKNESSTMLLIRTYVEKEV